MLCCCERDEQTASRIMSDYNIDLGEWGVSSVPALMAKSVGSWEQIFTKICVSRADVSPKSEKIELDKNKLSTKTVFVMK